jgi:S1-C subfamily serine protease
MDIDDFKRKGPSIWSFLLMGIIGAAIGAFLTLSFAPAFMFEGMPSGDDSIGTAYTPKEEQGTDGYLSYAARSIKPSLVSVAAVKGEKSERKVISSRTGVVIDSSGYILTGYQPSSSKIYVYLQDNSSLPGETVWADKDMGLSIIKINESKLTAATLGDSDKQQVGQLAAAAETILGSKLEVRLSSGILSAIDRSIMVEEGTPLQNLMQNQASTQCIDPVGTPLLNSSGEVIGINIGKVSESEEEGFAIPINLLKPVIYSISLNGEVKEPDLGIEGVDRELANYYHVEVESGIYIKELIPGGGAELAGLEEGDVILSVSSNPVNTLAELKEELYKIGVGNIANLKVRFKDGTVDYVGVILNEKD